MAKKRKSPKKRAPWKKRAAKTRKSQRKPRASKLSLHPEVVADIIRRGRQRGFVTFNEIAHLVPRIEHDIAGLEKLYYTLGQENIDIVEQKSYLRVEKEEQEEEGKELK